MRSSVSVWNAETAQQELGDLRSGPSGVDDHRGGSLRLEVSSTPGALDRDADGVHDCADDRPARANATQES
jgi:hypothetical protein